MRRRYVVFLIGCALSALSGIGAQAPSSDPVAVFLDCGFSCDQDFVRTEITYVSWVRDRAASDVHILVTEQGTGGGGSEFTLAFLGQRSFASMVDTLRYVAPQSATDDETRRGMTRIIKLGLARFLARNAIATRLNLVLLPLASGAPEASTPVRDPWNLWVFSIGANGNLNGEKSSTFSSGGGNLSARRTTDLWKVNFFARNNYSESVFEYGATESKFIQRNISLSQLTVRSLGPRWSAGVLASAGASTRENKKLYARFTPAVEFDLFPYSESTRRMLTLQYAVGAEHFAYKEETIYFKRDETRPVHSLSVNLSQTQPWGSVNIGAEAGQYLDETNRNNASVFASTRLRLFKGFNLNFGGGFESIHNQLYLPRTGATPEEVLLQQRRLQTSYSYFGFSSISYTFGSVFNSVVNPRFGGGGGGMMFFF